MAINKAESLLRVAGKLPEKWIRGWWVEKAFGSVQTDSCPADHENRKCRNGIFIIKRSTTDMAW
jgi:hypothetical protein